MWSFKKNVSDVILPGCGLSTVCGGGDSQTRWAGLRTCWELFGKRQAVRLLEVQVQARPPPHMYVCVWWITRVSLTRARTGGSTTNSSMPGSFFFFSFHSFIQSSVRSSVCTYIPSFIHSFWHGNNLRWTLWFTSAVRSEVVTPTNESSLQSRRKRWTVCLDAPPRKKLEAVVWIRWSNSFCWSCVKQKLSLKYSSLSPGSVYLFNTYLHNTCLLWTDTPHAIVSHIHRIYFTLNEGNNEAASQAHHPVAWKVCHASRGQSREKGFLTGASTAWVF